MIKVGLGGRLKRGSAKTKRTLIVRMSAGTVPSRQGAVGAIRATPQTRAGRQQTSIWLPCQTRCFRRTKDSTRLLQLGSSVGDERDKRNILQVSGCAAGDQTPSFTAKPIALLVTISWTIADALPSIIPFTKPTPSVGQRIGSL